MKLFCISFTFLFFKATPVRIPFKSFCSKCFKKSFLNSHHVNTWCAECRRRMFFFVCLFFGTKKDPSTYRWCCIYIIWAFIVQYFFVLSSDICMINHRHNGDWHICSHHIRIGHTKEQHKRYKVPGTKHFCEWKETKEKRKYNKLNEMRQKERNKCW